MIQVTKAEAKRLGHPLDTAKLCTSYSHAAEPSEGWTPRRVLRRHGRTTAGCGDQPLSQSETRSWGQAAPLPSPARREGAGRETLTESPLPPPNRGQILQQQQQPSPGETPEAFFPPGAGAHAAAHRTR